MKTVTVRQMRTGSIAPSIWTTGGRLVGAGAAVALAWTTAGAVPRWKAVSGGSTSGNTTSSSTTQMTLPSRMSVDVFTFQGDMSSICFARVSGGCQEPHALGREQRLAGLPKALYKEPGFVYKL